MQFLLIYELSNKNHFKNINDKKNSHISWENYNKEGVTKNAFTVKAKTKNEMYKILTTEDNQYLPPQRETSIYFVKGIIHGKKRVSFYS